MNFWVQKSYIVFFYGSWTQLFYIIYYFFRNLKLWYGHWLNAYIVTLKFTVDLDTDNLNLCQVRFQCFIKTYDSWNLTIRIAIETDKWICQQMDIEPSRFIRTNWTKNISFHLRFDDARCNEERLHRRLLQQTNMYLIMLLYQSPLLSVYFVLDYKHSTIFVTKNSYLWFYDVVHSAQHVVQPAQRLKIHPNLLKIKICAVAIFF